VPTKFPYECHLTDVLNSKHNLHWERNTQLAKQPQKRDTAEEGVYVIEGEKRGKPSSGALTCMQHPFLWQPYGSPFTLRGALWLCGKQNRRRRGKSLLVFFCFSMCYLVLLLTITRVVQVWAQQCLVIVTIVHCNAVIIPVSEEELLICPYFLFRITLFYFCC
jgi:hypothetical protein